MRLSERDDVTAAAVTSTITLRIPIGNGSSLLRWVLNLHERPRDNVPPIDRSTAVEPLQVGRECTRLGFDQVPVES